MGYYLCGYSNNNFIISKSLLSKKITTVFGSKIFKKKIFSESPFELSIKLNKDEEIKMFIVYCNSRENVYNYLLNIENKDYEKQNQLNILKTFKISYNNLDYSFDRIYYCLKRHYPYDILIFRILIEYLPVELINMILKLLKQEIVVSFKINKARFENSYYFCLPSVLY